MAQADTLRMDSLVFEADSANQVIKNNPVLYEETKSPDFHRYPFSEVIRKDLTPDWILYICLSYLVLFAWINLIYTRFLGNILHSSVNYQASIKLHRDSNTVQKRISFLFMLTYFSNFGLFLFLLYDNYNQQWLGNTDLVNYFLISGFLVSLSLLKFFLYKITALVFDQGKIFTEALFHNSLYNKITGIIIVPFIILIAYTHGIYQDIFIYLSLTVVLVIFVLRLFRAVVFVRKNVVSFLYFILYLCSLEILPVLVITKLILFLAKRS